VNVRTLLDGARSHRRPTLPNRFVSFFATSPSQPTSLTTLAGGGGSGGGGGGIASQSHPPLTTTIGRAARTTTFHP